MTEVVGKLLKMASNQMITDFDHYTKKFGLTGNQLIIIDYLYDHKNKIVYQSDIEDLLLIRRSTASVLLNRMVSKKLIQRIVDENDARKKRLVLTSRALKIRQQTRGYLALEHQHLRSVLNESEITQLASLLTKILKIGD